MARYHNSSKKACPITFLSAVQLHGEIMSALRRQYLFLSHHPSNDNASSEQRTNKFDAPELTATLASCTSRRCSSTTGTPSTSLAECGGAGHIPTHRLSHRQPRGGCDSRSVRVRHSRRDGGRARRPGPSVAPVAPAAKATTVPGAVPWSPTAFGPAAPWAAGEVAPRHRVSIRARPCGIRPRSIRPRRTPSGTAMSATVPITTPTASLSGGGEGVDAGAARGGARRPLGA